jgi:hypothetical protein
MSRTRAGSPPAPRPGHRRARAPTATTRRTRGRRPRRSARPAARRWPLRSRRSCANACECPRRARSWPSVLLSSTETDTWPTRLARGGATHLSSHARHPRPATSDNTQASQALARPTASKTVSSPPVATISSTSDITDEPNQNSKPHRGSRPSSPRPARHSGVGVAASGDGHRLVIGAQGPMLRGGPTAPRSKADARSPGMHRPVQRLVEFSASP